MKPENSCSAVAALKEAVKAVGSQTRLAAIVHKAQGHASYWLLHGLPHVYAPEIEKASGIPAERLCPGTKWCRIADPTWPHPDGRPLVDFSAPLPIAAAAEVSHG